MTYKRVVITRHGGPEVLQIVEEELPEPQVGQVRVRILAAGIANTDTMLRESNVPGLGAPSPPYTPGKELVGVVDALGEGVSTLEVGDTVASCLTGVGAYSEYICAPEAEWTSVPPGLDPAEAVCLVANYVVAYQVLHRAAQVAPGERVLIHGAAGGIGTALLQLGKLAEIEMYGTASSGKQELVASLGATPIDDRVEDFVQRIFDLTGDGVDVVCDSIGGSHVRRLDWTSCSQVDPVLCREVKERQQLIPGLGQSVLRFGVLGLEFLREPLGVLQRALPIRSTHDLV